MDLYGLEPFESIEIAAAMWAAGWLPFAAWLLAVVFED